MLQHQALREYLPRGYQLDVEDELLTISCRWCGWELVRPCCRYSVGDVLEAVYHHHAANHQRPVYAR